MKDKSFLIFALATSSLAPKIFSDALPFEARLAYLPVFYFAFLFIFSVFLPQKNRYSSEIKSGLILGLLPAIALFSYLSTMPQDINWPYLLKSHVSVLLFIFATFAIVQRTDLDGLLRTYFMVVKFACLLTIAEQVVWIFCKIDLLQPLDAIFLGMQFRGEDGILKRVHAWYREPAHYSQFLSIAVILVIATVGNKVRAKELGFGNTYWKLTILASSLMTFSVTGLISFALGIGMLSSKVRRWPIAFVAVVSILFLAGTSNTIQLRIDAIFSGTQDYTQNLTVYSYVSNFLAASDSLIRYPLGRGLGHHELAHSEWLSHQNALKNLDYRGLNSQDGGSLLFRLTSELGLGAFVLFGLWFFKTLIALVWRSNTKYHDVRLASLLAIFCYALRQGSYTLFELWFFIAAYMVANNSIQHSSTEEERFNEHEGLLAHAATR